MARGRRPAQDHTTLQMALVGYEIEKEKIQTKIREVERALGINHGPATAARPRRKLSVAARRRIAAAQKRRWAEHRKKVAAQKSA